MSNAQSKNKADAPNAHPRNEYKRPPNTSPIAVVTRKMLMQDDFMLSGACEYTNSSPVIETSISETVIARICGNMAITDTVLGSFTSMVL